MMIYVEVVSIFHNIVHNLVYVAFKQQSNQVPVNLSKLVKTVVVVKT